MPNIMGVRGAGPAFGHFMLAIANKWVKLFCLTLLHAQVLRAAGAAYRFRTRDEVL